MKGYYQGIVIMDISTLKELKQRFNLSDEQEYEYSVNDNFLQIKLITQKNNFTPNIGRILNAIDKIEQLDIQEDIPDLSETYKNRLYGNSKI